MVAVDLAVIGAGLSGCSLTGRLHQLESNFSIALVEAGRGAGGRTASRRRRDHPWWRLDHGAPGFGLSDSSSEGVKALLAPLKADGILQRDHRPVLRLDSGGGLHPATDLESCPEDGWWRGVPCMASICEALLERAASAQLSTHFGARVRWLTHEGGYWRLVNEQGTWELTARRLVLSGSLLAHPRSLAMLAWDDVPLRSAVAAGLDADLDAALNQLQRSESAIRWNLMVDLGVLEQTEPLPRQIWLDEEAKMQWQVERIVLHPQSDGRLGLVVHGLDQGDPITPTSQGGLIEREQKRLAALLPDLLQSLPDLAAALKQASPLGVMRWGASQPINHPLPAALQWCSASSVGFCGDWIEGPGFGTAEGAIRSGVNLAERLHADR